MQQPVLNQVAQPFQGYRQRDRADDHDGLIAQVRGRRSLRFSILRIIT